MTDRPTAKQARAAEAPWPLWRRWRAYLEETGRLADTDRLPDWARRRAHAGEHPPPLAWLRRALQEGPRLRRDVMDEAIAAGLEPPSVAEAGRDLALISKRRPGEPGGLAYWMLPQDEWLMPEGCRRTVLGAHRYAAQRQPQPPRSLAHTGRQATLCPACSSGATWYSHTAESWICHTCNHCFSRDTALQGALQSLDRERRHAWRSYYTLAETTRRETIRSAYALTILMETFEIEGYPAVAELCGDSALRLLDLHDQATKRP